jgi:hypothetical protein
VENNKNDIQSLAEWVKERFCLILHAPALRFVSEEPERYPAKAGARSNNKCQKKYFDFV